uniref:Ribonuclease Z n=1 Tax=Gracilaria ferox TaxID=1184158 RepID=A0A345U6Z2_9FLOR|nr:ribonuclease Z [Gracilaria ferox]AXI96228.1 ribonuclease Z [Gracilaria ferox]UAD85712.1 ribonuclease Z [Gracilaria ferox]
MKIIHLNYNDFFIQHIKACFYCKFRNLKTVWLFNCCNGCQHYLMKQKIKISQVSKIIITEMTICNISGLPGLLSSLSLSNKKSAVHIYGPTDLAKYLELIKKYSKTNFRYNLYFHQLKTNYIIKDHKYQIYCLKKSIYFEFIVTIPSNKGKFKLHKAKQWQIETGPMYGKLKRGYDFMLPDGTTISSKDFTDRHKKDDQISFLFSHD